MRFNIVFKLSLLSLVILSSFEASSVVAKSSKAHDHDRLPGWHGEIHSVEDTIARRKQESRKTRCSERVNNNSFTVSLNDFGESAAFCPLEVTERTASAANIFNTNEEEEDRWCPGEPVSLYDVDNVLKGNYKHMAMVETLPWKGPARGNVLLAWQTSEKIEGTKQRIVMAEADGKGEHLRFKALTANEQRKIFADVGSYSVPTDAGENGAVWGPVLFANPKKNHEIWLFYSQSRTNGCGSRVPGMDYAPGGDILAKKFNVVSGAWTHTEKIVLSQDFDDGIPKVTANKPIVLRRSGRWVLPYWNERAMLESPSVNPESCSKLNGKEGAGVLLSDDHGESWYPSETIRGRNTWLIENAVVELETDDHLLMVFRTKAGYVFRSESLDGGQTWTDASAMKDVPNPNSKIDMIRLQPSGLLALAFNDGCDFEFVAYGEQPCLPTLGGVVVRYLTVHAVARIWWDVVGGVALLAFLHDHPPEVEWEVETRLCCLKLPDWAEDRLAPRLAAEVLSRFTVESPLELKVGAKQRAEMEAELEAVERVGM